MEQPNKEQITPKYLDFCNFKDGNLYAIKDEIPSLRTLTQPLIEKFKSRYPAIGVGVLTLNDTRVSLKNSAADVARPLTSFGVTVGTTGPVLYFSNILEAGADFVPICSEILSELDDPYTVCVAHFPEIITDFSVFAPLRALVCIGRSVIFSRCGPFKIASLRVKI